MKYPIRMLCLLTALILLMGCRRADIGANGQNSPHNGNNGENNGDAVMDILSVSSDGYLVNENGERIKLKGVNLGGWLLQETWMCAVQGSESNLESLEKLESRSFTDEQIEALYTSYAENYITEDDIRIIADLGLNCIRLPFWYRNFMDSNCEFYSENKDEIFGFRMIDRLLDWAEKYGLYVILDMHGCPGGQSTDHSCGVIGKNELYTNDIYLDAMERLWCAVAERYKDRGCVAAYDIMNEPMNNNSSYENGWAAGSAEAVSHTLAVYDRMIKAIRKIDGAHIITVEGVWSCDMLPDPEEYGWSNMMYQLHLYDTSTEMIDYRVNELTSVREKYGVAVYVGEFNNGDTNQTYAYRKYCENDINWTMWTYKVSKNNLGNWSLYYYNVPPADIENDSYEELLDKWGESLRTENFTLNTTVRNWLRLYAKK